MYVRGRGRGAQRGLRARPAHRPGRRHRHRRPADPPRPWWARTGSASRPCSPLLAGRLVPGSGAVTVSPPSATVVLLPQERDRRPGETLRGYLARRTGVAVADQAMAAASEALAAGADGADDALRRGARALARPRRRGPGHPVGRWCSTGSASAAPCSTGRRRPSPVDSWRAAAWPRSFSPQVDVLLLDEPTNDLDARRPRLPRVVPRRPRGGLVVVSHDRAFLDRLVDQRPGDRRVHPPRSPVRRWLRGLPRGARPGPRRSQGRLRGVRRDSAPACASGPAASKEWSRQGTARATSDRARAAEPDKFIRHAQRRPAPRPGGRPAARVQRQVDRLEEVEDPRDPWQLRLPLDPATRGPRRGGRAGRRRWSNEAGSGSARSTSRSGGATGSRSPARTARASPRCCRAARPAPARPRSRLARAAAWSSARSTRCAGPSTPAPTWSTRSGRRPVRTRRRPARCWRSSASAPTTCCARSAASHRRAHPGRPRPAPCPAAPTCWCSTSRPTTSTWPPSSSSKRR